MPVGLARCPSCRVPLRVAVAAACRLALVLAAAAVAPICACQRVMRLVQLPLVAMSMWLPVLVARLVFVRVLRKLGMQERCASLVAQYRLLVAQVPRLEVV